MVDYPIAGTLFTNAAIHCAALVITQDVISGPGWPTFAQPDSALRNGTLTFVKSRDRTYGITCQHVVQHYRDVISTSRSRNSHSMRTIANGFYVVVDSFVQPNAQFGESRPDIAIREVRPDFIVKIGKKPIDIDARKEAPEDMKHAYAVGFPEKLKYKKYDNKPGFFRVAMPQREILAELPRRPVSRFAMFSEIEPPAPDSNLSGMSGGPVFWSTIDDYGILGIIYEGKFGQSNKEIYIFGEIASPDIIRSWIDQC